MSELEFPVLDGLLTHYLEAGAKIKKQDGLWHLFAKDGNGLAQGETITKMLTDLILREGA